VIEVIATVAAVCFAWASGKMIDRKKWGDAAYWAILSLALFMGVVS
jgi:hypothetical protein